MRVIGITGGVGSGKTRILSYLKEHVQCEILVADEIAASLKEPGEKCYEQLVRLLGIEILDSDKRINNKKMAALIFGNERLLQAVNDCIHPPVMEYILIRINKLRKEEKVKVVFLEAALLIEAGYLPYLDELWYIYVNKEVRIGRLQRARNYTREKTESIIARQLPDEVFKKYADIIIDNSGDFEDTKRELDSLCKKYET